MISRTRCSIGAKQSKAKQSKVKQSKVGIEREIWVKLTNQHQMPSVGAQSRVQKIAKTFTFG